MKGMRFYSSAEVKCEVFLTKIYLSLFLLISATLGGFSLGTSLAWTSPAFTSTSNFDFVVDTSDQSWVGALLPLGAATVAFPIGFLMDRFGRKLSMLMTVVPFTIGWALIIWPTGVSNMCKVSQAGSHRGKCYFLWCKWRGFVLFYRGFTENPLGLIHSKYRGQFQQSIEKNGDSKPPTLILTGSHLRRKKLKICFVSDLQVF